MKRISKAHYSVSTRRIPFAKTFLAVCILLCLTTLLATGLTAQSPNTDLAGTWKGELGEGSAKLHLVLTITKSANGEFSGELNSVDQGATLPMNNIILNADLFRFEVKAVGGLYEGKLNSTKTEIAGTWTQSGAPTQPLNFARAPSVEEKPTPSVLEGPKEKPLSVFLDVVVPLAPTAFRADGKWHLVYELHVNNMDRWNYQLTRIEAISGDSSARPLVTYTGAALDAVTRKPGQLPSDKEKSALSRNS